MAPATKMSVESVLFVQLFLTLLPFMFHQCSTNVQTWNIYTSTYIFVYNYLPQFQLNQKTSSRYAIFFLLSIVR